jgi:hypothetical protein
LAIPVKINIQEENKTIGKEVVMLNYVLAMLNRE